MHQLLPLHHVRPPAPDADAAAWESLARGLFLAYQAGELTPRAYTVLFFALAAQSRGWRLN